MTVSAYLFYDGNCEAAFKFYEKALGGKIDALMTYESAPPSMPTDPALKDKVMHVKMTIGDSTLMGSDAPPGRFHAQQGFAVSLQMKDPNDAAARFKALSEGGTVNMPFSETFWSKGFGMCIDKFGTPWMVNVDDAPSA